MGRIVTFPVWKDSLFRWLIYFISVVLGRKDRVEATPGSLLWILVLSNVQRTLINFSCLSSFILWDRLSVQLLSSPTELFATDNFLIYDLRILRTLHRRQKGTLALWGLWRECLPAMGPPGTSKQEHGLLRYIGTLASPPLTQRMAHGGATKHQWIRNGGRQEEEWKERVANPQGTLTT